MGQEVIRQTAADPEFVWDGRDHTGTSVPPGLYVLRLLSTQETPVQQVKLIKVF